MPSGIQELVTHGLPRAAPIAAPILRQAMPCSIQNLRMPVSGWASVMPLGRLGMREVSRIEIHAQSLFLAPIDPALEVLGKQFVPIDPLAAGLGVTGMEIEAVLAGNQREGLDRVAAQLIGRAGLAGVIAGDGQPPAQFLACLFKSPHVVALPAMQRNGHGRQTSQGRVSIDPQRGVALLGHLVNGFDLWQGGGSREDRRGHGVSSVGVVNGAASRK